MDNKTKLATLIRVNDEIQGSIIVSKLESAGIKSHCTGVFAAGFRAEAPGYVDIVVDEKDLPQARKILQTIDLEEAKVDWSKVDVGEPES